MLKSFEINNLNSIRDPILFSMEADLELTEKENYINHLDEESHLLKVASIYGPNASGKSTLLLAINYVKDLVLGRLSREFQNQLFVGTFPYAPFEFTKTKDNRTKVSLLFAQKNIEYWYEVTSEFVEEENIKVISEFFGVKTEGQSSYENVFSREYNSITANKILNIIGASKLPVSNDMTLLRHLFINYINADDEYDFTSTESMHLKYVDDLFKEIKSIALITNLSDIPARKFHFQGDSIRRNKKFIIESLNRLDIHISDIVVEEIKKRHFQIYCIHEIGGVSYKLRIEQESQGTALLIYLLSIILSRKNSPTIFLIDELDSHLHPKLVKEIIDLFNSEFNQHNQLIFNSHDMWNMVPARFRRDQIWFTYRNDELATELLCLSDIVNYKGERVRKDAKYSKQYMEGKFGADPFIRKGLDWYGE